MRPNIVFYFSDQQRWDTCGCLGQKLDVTPNLDRMAAGGALFENAFTCQPVCGPARACLQSGLYATQTGCVTNGIPLPLGQVTLAKLLGEAGYDTAYIGKWHLASQNGGGNFMTLPVPPERRGGYRHWMAADVLEFTSHGYNGFVYDGEGEKTAFTGYRADCVNAFAVDYLHNRPKDRPFFLFVSQIEPHHQNDHKRFEGPDGSKRRFADFETPGDLEGTAGDWRENYPDYLGCCHALDRNVGSLLDTLDAEGVLRDTVVIYTSDHGSHFCTRNSEYKRACHDGCTHIPMIARGPGFDGVGRVGAMVSLMDIPATILDCAGVKKPDGFQGRSLREFSRGAPPPDWPDDVFIQISESQIGRCVRTARWKYSVRAPGSGWKRPSAMAYFEEYLYDVANDPHERDNRVLDPSLASVRAEMAVRLKKRMAGAGEAVPEILPYDAAICFEEDPNERTF